MNVSEALIREIVERVVKELDSPKTEGFTKEVDKASGILVVKTAEVKPEPFDTGKKGDKVFLKDIVTLEESPRMGAGIMEMDQSKFEWTLRYDEFDYIIEGTLEIICNGVKTVANKGDILLIPANSSIEFSVPNFARFAYFVYPANWADQ